MNTATARTFPQNLEATAPKPATPAGGLFPGPGDQAVLAFIPARGGSKGLPGKNILDLCGKPLLAYSIEAALAMPQVSKVVVSTDDPRIADVAREHGAEVPFLRSKALAQDNSLMPDVLGEAYIRLREELDFIPSVTVTLYPTHPFRTRSLMNSLLARAMEGYRNVITVRSCPVNPWLTRHEKGALRPASFSPASEPGRLGHRFYGLFHAAHHNWSRADYIHLVEDSVSLIDIDTLGDFLLAEEVIRRGLYDFNGINVV